MPAGLDLTKRIYASMLNPSATQTDVMALTDNVRNHTRFIKGVVVSQCHARLASSRLKGTGIEVVCPVAYPLGNLPTELKCSQASGCIREGASSVTAVMKIEALRAGDLEQARSDASQMAGAVPGLGLIANAACLTHAQIAAAAGIARDLGAVFVTNAGFGMDSTLGHVRVARAEGGEGLHIVAAGGIRNAQAATEYLEAGADAIATSHAFEIILQLGHITNN